MLSERKRDVDHPLLSNATVKHEWRCTYFPTTPIGLCLLSMDRNNSTLLPYHLQDGVTPSYPFLTFYFFLRRFAFFLLSVFGMYLFQISAGPPTSLTEDFLNHILSLGSCLDSREVRALLGFCAAWSGNPLPTFRNNLSVPSSRVKKSKIFDFSTYYYIDINLVANLFEICGCPYTRMVGSGALTDLLRFVNAM